MGRLLFGMIGAVAQFEREIMLDRQREGIARGDAEGKYKGRAPTVRRQLDEMRSLQAEGVTPSELAGNSASAGRASTASWVKAMARHEPAPLGVPWHITVTSADGKRLVWHGSCRDRDEIEQLAASELLGRASIRGRLSYPQTKSKTRGSGSD